VRYQAALHPEDRTIEQRSELRVLLENMIARSIKKSYQLFYLITYPQLIFGAWIGSLKATGLDGLWATIAGTESRRCAVREVVVVS
jgi:hypothetical protein